LRCGPARGGEWREGEMGTKGVWPREVDHGQLLIMVMALFKAMMADHRDWHLVVCKEDGKQEGKAWEQCRKAAQEIQ